MNELLKQKQGLNISVQILVFDDASENDVKQANRRLENERDVIYYEMERNVGRSSIRNRLAERADGSCLLFLDDDSKIIHQDFLKNYIDHWSDEAVVCGGRKYTKELPLKQYGLHWYYGRYKESKTAEQRAAKPYESFHSNNFVIPKKIWEKVPFDESLSQYGHEDTLLGYELKKNHIPVIHINNQVIHSQLDDNKDFLRKSKLAVENLKFLYDRGDQGFINSVKLLQTYHRIRKGGLKHVFAGYYKMKRNKWERHLINAEEPSLRIFNLYKLGYLCSL